MRRNSTTTSARLRRGFGSCSGTTAVENLPDCRCPSAVNTFTLFGLSAVTVTELTTGGFSVTEGLTVATVTGLLVNTGLVRNPSVAVTRTEN